MPVAAVLAPTHGPLGDRLPWLPQRAEDLVQSLRRR